jgi:uncharacterized phiE125 gp8 family phage protein
MALRLITAPAGEIVPLSEMKIHLRVDIDDDDILIDQQQAAAREFLEGIFLNRALLTQTWELVLDAWPGGDEIAIPRPPLQSVTSVKYYDEDSVESTLSSSSYIVDNASEPGRLVLKASADWPSVNLQVVNGIVIEFVAGFGDADDVPEVYKQALKLMVGDMYENREDTLIAQGVSVSTIPFGVKRMLQGKRIIPV